MSVDRILPTDMLRNLVNGRLRSPGSFCLDAIDDVGRGQRRIACIVAERHLDVGHPAAHSPQQLVVGHNLGQLVLPRTLVVTSLAGGKVRELIEAELPLGVCRLKTWMVVM